MATKNRKAQLEIEAKNNTKGPLNEIKRDLEGVGTAGEKAGRQVSEGMEKVSAGADKASKALDRQERSMVRSMERRQAMLIAEGKGIAAQQEALAKIRGLDDRPAIRQAIQNLSQVEQQQLRAAKAAKDEAQAQREATAAKKEASRQQKAFIDSLREQALYAGKSKEEILELKAAQLGVGDEARGYIDSIRQSNAALQTGGKQLNEYGMSAKQTANAMRLIPMQMTDIVTQLAGGQSPLLVLTQQGGQLKDVFGGIQPALRGVGQYLMALVNPLTVAAAGVAAVYGAFRMGAAESERFNKAIVETGGTAGVTADELQAMAQRIDGVVGTQRKASAVLTEFARTTTISRENIEAFAESTIRWQQATGTAAEEIVAQFEELGRAPLEATVKLNESMNFLTASTYEQITALVDAGRETEAAAAAQKAYADALDRRAPEMAENVGLLVKAWRSVKVAATEALDFMAGIGRQQTLLEQIAESESRIMQLMDRAYENGAVNRVRAVEAERERLRQLEGQLALESSLSTIRRQADEERRRQTEELQFRRDYRGDRLSQDEQRIEAINREVQEFERATARLDTTSKEYQDLWRRHQAELKKIDEQYADKGTGGRSGSAGSQNELARLRALIEVEQQREAALHSASAAQASLNEGEKLAIQYAEKIKLATDEKTKAQLQANKALAEQYGALKRANDQFDAQRKAQESTIDAVRKQTDSLRDQIDTYGLGRSAIEAMTIARLEEQIAMTDPAVSEATIDGLKRELEARKELLSAMRTKEALDEQLREWQNWEREVDRIFDQLGQSLTDHLFEGGKSARELLKDMFKALTLRVVVQPVMSQIQGMVTNQLGGAFGYQNPQQQSGGFSFTGGGTFGAGAVSDIGGWMAGSSVQSVSDLGAKLVTSADTIAKVGGNVLGYGKAIYDLTQGNYGRAAGAAIGTYFGGPVGAFFGGELGGLVDGLFDREPTTRREQRTQVEFAGGLFDVTKRDDRAPAGADAAARALAEQAVSTANDIFKQVGVDAAIDSFHAIMASSHKGDRDGVASGGTLRIGDQLRQFGIANEGNPTIQGFGGWSDADTLPRLATDIQLSIIEALQQAGVMSHRLSGIDVRGLDAAGAEQLAATIQQVVQEIGALEQAVAQLPFANLRDLSFEAYDGLLMLSGGLDSLIAAEQSYLQNFYSEAERTQLTWDAISRTLGEVNIAVPETRDEFRAIKESLDLNTESGRQAYAAIMSVQDAFASVTQSADELAAAAIRAAEEQARATEQLRQQALGDLESAYNAMVQAGQREIARLQESFSATDSAMSAYRSKVQEYINSFNGLFSAIDQGVKALRGTGAAFQADYNRARAVISTTLLTGQLPQTADLSDALRTAQQGVTGQVYASRFEQEKAYATLANEMEAIKEIAEPELDAAQATLNQLEDQYRLLRGMSQVGEDSLESLEAQLRTALSTEEAARRQVDSIERRMEMAREQHDELLGVITEGFLTFSEAVDAFAKAALQVTAPSSTGGGSGLPADRYPNPIGPGSDYQRAVEYYRNNPDVANAFNTVPGATFVEFAKEHWEKYGKAEGRPSFAIGTNYVPYDMTANIHKGERIIPAADNRALIQALQGSGNNRELIAEVRQLRAEVAGLRGEQKTSQFAIAKYTQKTAKKLDEFSEIGMPVTEGIPA